MSVYIFTYWFAYWISPSSRLTPQKQPVADCKISGCSFRFKSTCISPFHIIWWSIAIHFEWTFKAFISFYVWRELTCRHDREWTALETVISPLNLNFSFFYFLNVILPPTLEILIGVVGRDGATWDFNNTAILILKSDWFCHLGNGRGSGKDPSLDYISGAHKHVSASFFIKTFH